MAVVSSDDPLEITQPQKDELETRLHQDENNKQGKTWNKVKAQLQQTK
jgi:hypothetical protein